MFVRTQKGSKLDIIIYLTIMLLVEGSVDSNDFKIKFPTIEGFKIDCMHWEKVGEEIEI